MATTAAALEALAAQVATLAEVVRRIGEREIVLEAMFQAGLAAGETRAREAMLGRAAKTSRPAKSQRAQPAHLRAVRSEP